MIITLNLCKLNTVFQILQFNIVGDYHEIAIASTKINVTDSGSMEIVFVVEPVS